MSPLQWRFFFPDESEKFVALSANKKFLNIINILIQALLGLHFLTLHHKMKDLHFMFANVKVVFA